MPRASKLTLARRAYARMACKAKQLRKQIRKNEIKTEPDDYIDLNNVLNVEVKEEPEVLEEDNFHCNYNNGEVCGLSNDPLGDFTEYGGCQNSESGNYAGAVTMAQTFSQSNYPSPNVPVSVRQEEHCLLCYKKCYSLDDALLENKENVFRAMFLMKKMLQVPNHMLEDYLLNFGSPQSWISLCVNCKVTVDKALQIHKSIGHLERALRNFQADIVDVIKKSVAWLPEIPVQSPSNEHVRRVANETRTFVSTGSYCKSTNSIIPKMTVKKSFAGLLGSNKTKKKSVKLKREHKRKPRKRDLSGQSSFPALSICVNPESAFTTNVDDADSNSFSSPTSNVPRSDSLIPTSKDSSNQQQSNTADEVEAITKLMGKAGEYLVYKDHVVPLKQKRHRVRLSLSQAVLNDPVFRDEKIYTCNLCPHLDKMRFHSFAVHILFHHKRPYRCHVCKIYYASHKELDHSPLNENRLKENATGHVCTAESLVETKFAPEKLWSCEHCPELFDLESQRDEHEQEVHPCESKNSSELKHGCITCSKKFRNLKDWCLHRATQHPDVALLSCYFCDENFGLKTKEGIDVYMGSSVAVNDHMRKQHNIDKPATFQACTCDFCGQEFMRSINLRKHMKEGHDVNPNRAFSCCICFCRTQQYSHVREHLENTHKAGTQESYVCDLCGYSGTRRDYFEVHNLQKHGIRPERGGVRTCKIEGCTFEYLYKSYIDSHMVKVHNAARVHTCQFCGKCFINRSHRIEHERIHLNKVEKPFKCKICGNSFALRNYLYIHMRLSHLNRPFASTNKKRPSRKSLGQGPSDANVEFRLTEPGTSKTFSSGQGSSILPVPHQNTNRDQPDQHEETSSAINSVST